VANKEHLHRLREGVESWNQWREVESIRPILSGAILKKADLSGAGLSGADLNNANLKGASFRGADLRHADLNDADLDGADLSGADLTNADLANIDLGGVKLRFASLSDTILTKVKFTNADLSNVNFSGADLSGTNLSNSDLSGANLSGALLIGSQLLGSDLTAAILTGACIQDWNINNMTQLDNITCDYIYQKNNSDEYYDLAKCQPSDRRPSNPNSIFAPGEFTKLFQKALSTIDLIFRNGVDWEALSLSLNKLRVEAEGVEISVQAIENKDDGTFIVRLKTPPGANNAEIEKYIKQEYESKEKLSRAQHKL